MVSECFILQQEPHVLVERPSLFGGTAFENRSGIGSQADADRYRVQVPEYCLLGVEHGVPYSSGMPGFRG